MRSIHNQEKGTVIVLVALFMTVFILIFAVVIDIGLIYKTKKDMQEAANAAALAGAAKLITPAGTAPDLAAVRTQTLAFASYNQLAVDRNDANTTTGGVVIGSIPDPKGTIDASNDFAATTTNPNSVQVTVKRNSDINGPLSLLFGGVTGQSQAFLSAKATASVIKTPIIGFDAPTGTKLMMLPFTCIDTYWTTSTDGSGDTDAYKVVNGVVSSGADGIPEVSIFPFDTTKGGAILMMASVSATNVETQITNGMTKSDLNAVSGLTFTKGSNGYYRQWLPGENWASSTWYTKLNAQKGKQRILPIFKRLNVGTTKPVTMGESIENKVRELPETCCAIDRYFEIVRYEGVTIVDTKSSSDKVIVQPTKMTLTPDMAKIQFDGPTTSCFYGLALTR